GQMMAGAVAASWGAQFVTLPQPVLIPVCIALGALGGMAWAALAGLLKTRFGVNEIFGGVALNAIINTIAIYFISGPWQPPVGGSAQSTLLFPADAWLLPEIETLAVIQMRLAIKAASVAVVSAALRATRFDLELKAAGKIAQPSRLMGVSVTRT